MSSRNVLHAIGLIVATPMLAHAQTEAVDPGATGPAWSPYLVGVLIGVLSMFTFYFSAKPLGASTAFANVAGLIGRLIAPRHTDSLHFYADKKASKIDWQVALVIGVIAGAFLAAWSGGEITGRWLPPMWAERFGESVGLRMAVGFLGGGLMAFAHGWQTVAPADTASAARCNSPSARGYRCWASSSAELPPRCFCSTPEKSGEIMAQDETRTRPGTKIPSRPVRRKTGQPSLDLGSFSA